MELNMLCLPKVYVYPKRGYILPSISLHLSLGYSKAARHVIPYSASTQNPNPATAKESRCSANYQPTIWSYDFLQSLKNDQTDITCKDKAEKLEKELKRVINDEDAEPSLLEMIDDIQRLGLGHRFQKDIKRAPDKFVSLEECNSVAEECLHVAALRFRLLRQHGYEVSQYVFKAFKDIEGRNFLECLSEDMEGVLSLHDDDYSNQG